MSTRPRHWTPADHHRPGRDTDAITDAIKAGAPVANLLANGGHRIGQILDLMRTWSDTGLRATPTDHNRTTPVWCDRHHQDRSRCPVPELCPGTPYHPGLDPTGERATRTTDEATTDRTRMIALLHQRARTDREITALAKRYTRTTPRPATGPGPGYCASCYRWHQTLAPVELRPDGRPRYTGLCRRCGQFRGIWKILPPLPVLEAWHTPGMHATVTLVRVAVAEAKAKSRRTTP